MTFMQRSFSYILHNKRNNGIMLSLFLFITTFVLLGSHVIEFTGQIAEKLRENIGGVIYLYPDITDKDDINVKKLLLTDEDLTAKEHASIKRYLDQNTANFIDFRTI